MDLYEKYDNDANLEKDGKWFTAEGSDPKKPIRFKIAYLGTSNPAYLKSGEKRARPFRKVDPGIEASLHIAMEVFLDSGLKGWENVLTRNKEPMEFTRENAKQLMKDVPKLYEILASLANDRDWFNDDSRDMEAEAKNSQTSLPTK